MLYFFSLLMELEEQVALQRSCQVMDTLPYPYQGTSRRRNDYKPC